MSADPFVLASRVITQQVRHLTGLLKQANGLADRPPEGTPARADFDHINNHKRKMDLLGLRWWAHKGAILNLSSGAEHVRGLMAIVVSDQLMPLSAMTLGRAIYEASFNTFWLIQPDVSTEQRIARWAGRLLHDSQAPPNALDSFGEVNAAEGEKERVLEGRGLGQKLMRQAGIELRLKGGDRSEETRLVTYQGEASLLTPKVTDQVARFTPNQQSLWPLFSGAAHSRGWLVEGLEGDAATIWSSVLVPLLDVSDALVIEVCAYFGMDARPTIERTHLHRRTMLAQALPLKQGMRAGWDAYRKAGGAPTLPKR
ncbi:hypothetical protein FB382_000996 [Nocardioides ginsengisegetis]|uniref:Uncharacterized protein n=1 Tax=Nocardioides ginsengisegetis TaxID=661491 RepID=A0A7W3IXZ2_9ACTN|nr:hypothetical protein [Nocardioides ginsengisegetis]MBA8802705.1 hypothetical protein [Nocardioides ginsengisegetis]